MSKEQKYQCLAVYLYYNEPWENFLSEAVLPYVKTTLQTGIATHFFFLRYWEQGPHIRLRFFGAETMLQEVLRPNLQEHFQTYFNSKPSTRIEPDFASSAESDYRWQANNSMLFSQYEPEWQRYGGMQGVAIAEQHFYASSQIVLQNMADKAEKWTYEDGLGTAIKLHLSFVFGLGMNKRAAHSFFHFVFHNWLPRSVRFQKNTKDDANTNTEILQNLEAFESAFVQQKNMLIPFHRQLWDALESQAEFEEKHLNNWLKKTQFIDARLKEVQEEGVLLDRPLAYRYSFWPESTAQSGEEKERWMHYADYMHMTNNRLGILNQDEGYLAFLMMKSIENL